MVYNGTIKISLLLGDVLFVPKLQSKLLSLSTITEKRVTVQFKGKFFELMINDKRYRIGHEHGELYILACEPIQESCFESNIDDVNSLTLWHCHSRHLGFDNVKLMNKKSIVDSIKFNVKEEVSRDCKGCAKGKMHCVPFQEETNTKAIRYWN